MTIFYFTYITFTLLLFSTVNSEKSNDDDIQICADLCGSCGGVGLFSDDDCKCHTQNEKRETTECIEEIREKAAEQNLTLVNIRHDILSRATRCCPNNRLRLSDILRVAKYFLKGGPEVGVRILGNSRNFEGSMSGLTDCQRCLYDEEDPTVELVTPEEESIDSYPTMLPPSMEYILGPQACTVQNPYPYNNFNALNTPSIDKIKSPYNYPSLVAPPTSLHDYSHDQLSPLLAHGYPMMQVTPPTAQNHLSNHQHQLPHGFIELSHTHLPTSNYPQDPLMRAPHQGYSNSRMSGTYRNSIWNPSNQFSSVPQASGFGTNSYQIYRPKNPGRRPLIQPLHTIYPFEFLPQVNNLAGSHDMSNINLQNRVSQPAIQFMSPNSASNFDGSNYDGDEIIGAPTPIASENNINDKEKNTSNINKQPTKSINDDAQASPSSQLSVAVQPNQSKLQSKQQIASAQTRTSGSLGALMDIKKRMTIPAILRYKPINKRELKMKDPWIN